MEQLETTNTDRFAPSLNHISVVFRESVKYVSAKNEIAVVKKEIFISQREIERVRKKNGYCVTLLSHYCHISNIRKLNLWTRRRRSFSL